MPRLNVVDPATATGRVKEIFDGPLKGEHLNIFKGFANSPAVLDAYLGMSGALNKSSLSGKEREAIALAVGQANDCNYCLAAHTALGKMAGMSEAETIAARQGTSEDPRIAALTKFAMVIHEKRGFVSDDNVATFRAAGFNDGEIAEVVAVYALNLFSNYFNHLNETEIDFPAAPALS